MHGAAGGRSRGVDRHVIRYSLVTGYATAGWPPPRSSIDQAEQ